MKGFKGNSLVLLAYLLVGFILYANTFSNPFLWDDLGLIVHNTQIKTSSLLPSLFYTSFLGSYYRPFCLLSFSLDYHLWGLNPWGYHLTNLLLHLANAFLAFALFKKLTAQLVPCFLAGLLFLLHPVQTNAVTYISGRTDLLATLFFLIALLLFREIEGKKSKWRSLLILAASLLAFSLALLSKEMPISLPVLLVLLHGWRKEGVGKPLYSWARIVPFFLIAGAYLLMRDSVVGSPFTIQAFKGREALLRLITLPKVAMMYAGIVFLPTDLHMERFTSIASSLLDPWGIISLSILFLVLFWAISSYKRGGAEGLGLLWLFITYLPVSNLVPLYPPEPTKSLFTAEQFLYLPSMGLFLALMTGFSAFVSSRARLRNGAFVLVAVTLLFLGLLTIDRNTDWCDDLTFYQKTVLSNPWSARMRVNLANALRERGRVDEALFHYEEAKKLHPFWSVPYSQSGLLLAQMGDYEKALQEYQKALSLYPTSSVTLNNLGNLYKKMGKIDEAIKAYQEALRHSPSFAPGYFNLGRLYEEKGRWEEAQESYEKAYGLDPHSAQIRLRLSQLYAKRGLWEKALELDPTLSKKRDGEG